MAAIPGMNPGLFVMAGGAGSGPGGAGGGRGGAGRQGASGRNGGAQAGGGGNGTGACGPGSGGGCPNPQHGGGGGTQAGHPVDPVTGRVYTLSVVDMALPGLFGLVIERSYSTTALDVDVGLGFGWSHSLAWRVIELPRDRVRLERHDALPAEGRLPPEGQAEKLDELLLVHTGSGYRLEGCEDGLARHFERHASRDNVFRLTALSDPNGNRTTLYYEDDTGPLVQLNDSVGRLVRVCRDREGRIEAFEVKNASTSGWTRFRTYEHDDAGNLSAARDAMGHAVSYEYDEEHRLIVERAPTGCEARYRYDQAGRCVESWCNDPNVARLLDPSAPATLADGTPAKGYLHVKIDYGDGFSSVVTSRGVRSIEGNGFGKADKLVWAGGVHENHFDEAGELVGYEDPLGRAWRFERGRSHFEVEDPLGQLTSYEYDDAGRVVRTVTPDGMETVHTRDVFGNLIELSDGLGPVVSLRYDDRGSLIQGITPDGGRTSMRYDALANRVEIVEPDGGTRRLTYDFLGRLVGMTDEVGGRHRWAYDGMGRLEAYTAPTGATTSYRYDADGRLVERHDPDGRYVRLVYAGLRQVVAVERSDGSRVVYRYDRELDLARVVNEEGDEHLIERDAEGRITLERTFDGRTLRYTNDEVGRVVKIDFGAGESVEIEYDALDRVVHRAYSDDRFHRFTYDPAGRVTAAETEEAVVLYSYDQRGRCVREVLRRRSEPDTERVVEHRYDAADRRVSSRHGDTNWQTPRDAAGRCLAMTWQRGDAGHWLARFSFDATGAEVSRELPGGARLASTRDPLGLPLVTSVQVPGIRPSASEPQWVGRAADETMNVEYGWTQGGELLSLRGTEHGAREYLRDGRGRLAQVRWADRAATDDYAHSPRGDLRTARAKLQEHAAGGRLMGSGGASYEYDERGRVCLKTTPAGSTRYEWSAVGLLERVTLPDGTTVQWVHDPFARSVEKLVRAPSGVTRHRYLWDGDDLVEELVERRDGGGAWSLVERRRYAYSPSGILPVAQAVDTPAGEGPWVYFVHREGAPVPLALVAPDGRPVAALDVEPYGRSAAGETLVRFPGHWLDRETGLLHNRWRHLDPETGAYLCPEPLGLLGGLQPYAYARGNPLELFDPNGLEACVLRTRDGREFTGLSTGDSRGGQNRNVGDLHPAVAAALPANSAAGGRPAHVCAEPAVLSNYLRDYERRTGRSCDPGSPEGRRNLSHALSQVRSMEATTDPGRPMQGQQTRRAQQRSPCPNCSQTISRLWALAEPPAQQPGIVGGLSSQQLQGPRPPRGQRRGIPNPTNREDAPADSPLMQGGNRPQANMEAYRAAGGTGRSVPNPGHYGHDANGAWVRQE